MTDEKTLPPTTDDVAETKELMAELAGAMRHHSMTIRAAAVHSLVTMDAELRDAITMIEMSRFRQQFEALAKECEEPVRTPHKPSGWEN